jgi:hypothetical protein
MINPLVHCPAFSSFFFPEASLPLFTGTKDTFGEILMSLLFLQSVDVSKQKSKEQKEFKE